ncbi:uncharacterized protein LOC111060980 [Nilaparvata lugens]|uniref:uncharacterized protein LOC111060980 n=1 Tax=Nilaparvata lugens TaxID=108931 RepID=UPI00193E5B96|nr:uncharacterized protein LOC111060980 [Nilaparvata lugens]
MSRGRKRKSEKGQFSAESMKNAVIAVLRGEDGVKLSIRKAAQKYGLKFQTLQRYVSKQRATPNEEISMAPKYKSRLIFNREEESSLAEYLITCSKMCYGKSTKDFRELAFEMAKMNNKEVPESWQRNMRAGVDWMQGFLKRNPQVRIHQPEACSLSRATSFNKHNVGIFFENLKSAYNRSESFCDGTRIYNLDETATTTVQKPKKVLASKGSKQVSKCTSGERGTLVTTCCIVSASGNSLPPAMVFPRKNYKEHMINGAPAGTLGLVTSNGWMTGEAFISVMKHFIKHSGSTMENPTILICDNHESHLTIETIDLAKQNGVIIVTLPPHCSNKLQPLDISVYQPFKAYYNTAVDSWLLHHPGTPLTIYQVAQCVGIAHERAMTPANIKAGFRRSGIFPFNNNLFTDDDFLVSYVTDRAYDNDLPSAVQEQDENEAEPSSSTNLTSPHDEFSIQIPQPPSHKCDQPDVSSPASRPFNSKQQFISPNDFKGFPKAPARKNGRKP